MKDEKKIRKTWDSFLVDASNEEAYKACKKIAEDDEKAPQILWMYGPSGCGKTHLAKAIGRGVIIPGLDAVEATLIRSTGIKLELESFFKAKLLVIDNVEDIVNTEGLQENVAELIAKKCQKGHRVILISTMPPKDFRTLNTRLIACPYHVKKTHIKSPDEALRLRYAQSRSGELNVTFEPDALEYLVKNTVILTTIEGAVQTASLYHKSKRCDTFDVAWVSNHLEKFKGCEILWQ